MNILFLSKLSGNKGCGPFYSIPHQVEAQGKIDNVMWININEVQNEDWKKWANVKNKLDYPNLSLNNLPKPFNNPDVVFFEEQYNFWNQKIVWEIRNKNIPYIIVPRCSLTKKALTKKKIKKELANVIFFKKFIKDAVAIQFLTEQEYIDSGKKWNKENIIIPNGVIIPETKKFFHQDKIECSFIGRIDIFHKGIDLLIEACSNLKNDLIEKNMHISIYGDGNLKDIEFLKKEINTKKLNKVISYNGPVYNKEKENVLLQTDVFILTSRFEGMPMGILESLSYGIPVLITEGTNMCNEVKRFNAGWTCNTNSNDIKKTLEILLDSSKEIFIKSPNCIKLADKYAWNSIAEKTHSELLRILKKKEV